MDILKTGAAVLGLSLGLASSVFAQGRTSVYQDPRGGATVHRRDATVIDSAGGQHNSPYTYTPYGAVYDPNGFLGHQYFNPYGVGNGGVPQYIDTNPTYYAGAGYYNPNVNPAPYIP